MPFPVTQPPMLTALRNSSHALWSEFYAAYFPTLVILARNQGLSPADAEDVAQHVMVRLIDALKDFEYQPEKGLFRSWLTRLTLNCARNYRRKRSRRDELKDQAHEDGLLPVAGEEPKPDNQLTANEKEELWRAMIGALLSDYAATPRVEPRNAEIARRLLLQEEEPQKLAETYGLQLNHVNVIRTRASQWLQKQLTTLFPDVENPEEMADHDLFVEIAQRKISSSERETQ